MAGVSGLVCCVVCCVTGVVCCVAGTVAFPVIIKPGEREFLSAAAWVGFPAASVTVFFSSVVVTANFITPYDAIDANDDVIKVKR